MTGVQGLELDHKGVVTRCAKCGQLNRLAYLTLGAETRCGKCKEPLAQPGEPIDIDEAGKFGTLVQASAIPVLVDFWADWCGPCKMMAPELARLAASEAGSTLILKVNTEMLPQLAAQFQISAIPTLILFRNGREIGRVSGARPANELQEFLRRSR